MFKLFINALGLATLMGAGAAFALDPTQPPGAGVSREAAVARPVTLRLQAILRGPLHARAVIDGHTLEKGDRLGDVRIIAVNSYSVIVDNQGQRQELRLSAPIHKTSRTQP